MKKTFVLFCAVTLCSTIYSNEFIELLHDFDQEINTSLSKSQKLQLDYLHDQLAKLGDSLQIWTQNKQVQNLLEIMELAVFQSSLKTRDIFEQQIIQIFKQSNIDVYFNEDGLIEKIDTSSGIIHKFKGSTKKLKFHHTNNNASTHNALQKIKGANKTRKKLEKAWKERREAAKRAAEQAQEQRNLIKKHTESSLGEMVERRSKNIEHQKLQDQITNNAEINSTDFFNEF